MGREGRCRWWVAGAGAGRSDEGPALHDLDDEVLARAQRLVAVRGAALRAAQVQVAVQPDAELAAEGNNHVQLQCANKNHHHRQSQINNYSQIIKRLIST